jgi:hypothetical protein
VIEALTQPVRMPLWLVLALAGWRSDRARALFDAVRRRGRKGEEET